MHISPNLCYCLNFLYFNIESQWMCVHAFCVHVKRHAPLCPLRAQKKAVKKKQKQGSREERERERTLEREDGRATGRRAPGWKGEPEVVSQPAFKSSPLGLTEPMTIHSVSLSVLLPTPSPGPSSWKCFCFVFSGFETMKKGRSSRRDQRGNEVGGWTVEGSFGFCRQHENACLSDRAHIVAPCIMQMKMNSTQPMFMCIPEQKRINQTV